MERPPPPPPPSKPQQQIHEVSSDDDDVTEFSQAEELAIASGRPLPPGSSSSSRRPPPPNSSSSRPEPTSAGVITKPTRSSTDFSAQGSKLPLPPFKRKEKAQLEGEADDESARALSASTSTSTNVGDVKRKVAAMNAAAQPLPMKPAPATGGVMKRMRGKGVRLLLLCAFFRRRSLKADHFSPFALLGYHYFRASSWYLLQRTPLPPRPRREQHLPSEENLDSRRSRFPSGGKGSRSRLEDRISRSEEDRSRSVLERMLVTSNFHLHRSCG